MAARESTASASPSARICPWLYSGPPALKSRPELELNAESMNARLTRLEDQLKSGSITVSVAPTSVAGDDAEELPPIPDDRDAPPAFDEPSVPIMEETPVGFWTDVVSQIRKELSPPASGFFVTTANAPVQARLSGNQLVLLCANTFTMEVINKPEILELVSRKASAKLGRPIRAVAADKTKSVQKSENMEKLLQFGRDHSDIIKIKEH